MSTPTTVHVVRREPSLRRPIGLILAGFSLGLPLTFVVTTLTQDALGLIILLGICLLVSWVGLVWLTLRLLFGETASQSGQDGSGEPFDPTRV